mmetsp:Transcript_109414/g.274061  ORF Transcript_109414/g.274061 Transcript_109414/m.274061 type:complete len:230 (-) Transcript_109414:741-1430(-)
MPKPRQQKTSRLITDWLPLSRRQQICTKACPQQGSKICKPTNKSATCPSQCLNLMHAAPRCSRRHALRYCGEPRLHAHILPLLSRAQVLECVSIVVANVPENPIWHVHFCQTQAPICPIMEHNRICCPAIQELNLRFTVKCHMLALLNLSATKEVADTNINFLALEPLHGAISTSLATEVSVQAAGEFQRLRARVCDLHFQAQGLCTQDNFVEELELRGPLLQHLGIWS